MGYLGRLALFVGAAALLAACGGSQPPIASPGAMPQGVSPQSRVYWSSGKSWMRSEATNDDLLYLSDPSGHVYVYSYPKFKQVGTLNISAVTQGLCVDAAGNVYVPAWVTGGTTITGYIYEFAHGGAEPIATFNDPNEAPSACAIDPTTQNLAVANYGSEGHGGVIVYPHGSGNPITYYPGFGPQWAAYNDNGDLFVDSPLAVLPKGASNFTNVTVNQSQSIEMFSLQWNDGYLTILGTYKSRHKEYIYRVSVSGYYGKIVGTTTLNTNRLGYGGNGQVLIQDNRVMGAGPRHHSLAVWRYPAGGNKIKTAVKRISPWGVVISPAPSRSRIRK